MKTLEIDSRILKAVNMYIAKKDLRYYLLGINLNKRGAIEAADGHTGIMHLDDSLNLLDKSLIIKIYGTIPSAAGTAVIELPKDGSSKGFITFSKKEIVLAYSVIDGQYPDMEKLIPSGDPVAVKKIGVNPSFISQAMKAAKTLGNKHSGMTLNFWGESTVITATIGNGIEKCSIFIMPMRC